MDGVKRELVNPVIVGSGWPKERVPWKEKSYGTALAEILYVRLNLKLRLLLDLRERKILQLQLEHVFRVIVEGKCSQQRGLVCKKSLLMIMVRARIRAGKNRDPRKGLKRRWHIEEWSTALVVKKNSNLCSVSARRKTLEPTVIYEL